MDLQRSLAARAVVAVALVCAQGLVAPKAHAGYMLVPGWTIEHYAALTDGCNAMAVDGQGNIYVCGNSGITRVDTTGAVSLWSRCVGTGLAVLPDGEAYVPSGDLLGGGLSYLWHVAPDGSYTPFAARTSGEGWAWAAVTASGKLYANVWAGGGEGLYAIDISTGAATPLIAGGPGPGGAGFYWNMAVRGDTLFVSASDGTKRVIYRLDGSALDLFATPGSTICGGPDGVYGETWQECATGGSCYFGDLWKATAGTVSHFASGFGVIGGMTYDEKRDRFYVVEGSRVWVIRRQTSAPGLADLAVSQTVRPDTTALEPDTTTGNAYVTYKVSVVNRGPDASAQVMVRDQLPFPNSPHSFTAPVGTVADSSGWGVWWISSLAVGDSAVMTVTQQAQAPGTMTNLAFASSVTADPDNSNNASAASALVHADIDVWAQVAFQPPSPTAGQPFVVNADYGNHGPGTSGPTTLDLSLSGQAVRVLSAVASGGSCTISGTAVSCRVDSLGAADSIHVRIQAISDSVGTLGYEAFARGTGGDEDRSNNEASGNVAVRVPALRLLGTLIGDLQAIEVKQYADASLMAALTSAQAALAAPDTSSACHDLQGFIVAVDHASGSQLDIDQAVNLIQETRAIVTLLSCDPPPLQTLPSVPTLRLLSQTGEAPAHLRFSVPTESQVRVEIYDILGRRVRRLADGTFAAGFHDVAWDDERGRPAGLYFARLTTPGSDRIMKVLRRR